MANTGLIQKNGKLYFNDAEVGNGGTANNEFNKIVVLGTSIESTPSANPWPKKMADALGMGYHAYTTEVYNSGVINLSLGGGVMTWFGGDVPQWAVIHVEGGFSCTAAEKDAAMDALIAKGYASNKNKMVLYNCYDNSILGNLDADLFIFATHGINDGSNDYRSFNGEDDGIDKDVTQNGFTVHSNLRFDRRTVYGAYNYVLRALYNAKPNAKVVILGQHTFQWPCQKGMNAVQRAVAEKWQIPFADWGNHLSLDETYDCATGVIGASKNIIYTISDGVHPTDAGADLLGTWVADWITKTELKPLNPRWGLE